MLNIYVMLVDIQSAFYQQKTNFEHFEFIKIFHFEHHSLAIIYLTRQQTGGASIRERALLRKNTEILLLWKHIIYKFSANFSILAQVLPCPNFRLVLYLPIVPRC